MGWDEMEVSLLGFRLEVFCDILLYGRKEGKGDVLPALLISRLVDIPSIFPSISPYNIYSCLSPPPRPIRHPRHRHQIICVYKIHSRLDQLPPNPVPHSYRPPRHLPIPDLDAPCVRIPHMLV